jgi:ribosomal protein L11 methyltransferase
VAAADLLRVALVVMGIPEQDIVEETRKNRTSLSFFFTNTHKAKQVLIKLRALKLKGFTCSLVDLKDSDWKTKWKKYVKPFNITRRLRIIPLWKPAIKIKNYNKNVYIDTSIAFGSGLHATTQMMAKFIAGQEGDFLDFFDVGTGSGILSIIAHKYGAKQIYAIDLDKDAVATAKRNFKINQCVPAYLKSLSFENAKIKKSFDFVCANLLTEDLIRLQDELIAYVAPGKYLAVSGIHRDNYAGFRRRFRNKSLECLRVSARKGWYALLFRKGERSLRCPEIHRLLK